MFVFPLCAVAQQTNYVGSAICASCHKEIAATQSKTRMAQTWQGSAIAGLPSPYNRLQHEGPIEYRVSRQTSSVEYSLSGPHFATFKAPVTIAVGGNRHGISFMVPVDQIGGIPLERATLVETRFQHSALTGGLALTPGLPVEKPASLETALGLVLSTRFESNCLTCHGQPAGVQCESCHGPGGQHIQALSASSAGTSHNVGMPNPKNWTPAQKMAICESCHRGFSPMSDPTPDDLLISNQTNALKHSECWRQTNGGGFSCVNCHNPHNDRTREQVIADSVRTCLQCHSPSVSPHPALCPVNRTSSCIDCHMPKRAKAWFQKSDHWIRVYPDGKVHKSQPGSQTQVTPQRLFLRVIATHNETKAHEAAAKLAAGVSFFDVASQYSTDDTAPGGGYLGDVAKEDLNPAWADAALHLRMGQTSAVIANPSGDFFIIQRVERNFKIEAVRHFDKAMSLRASGNKPEAQKELLASLRIDPRFVRALTWLGVGFAEDGKASRALGVLRYASQLDPADPGAVFNLAVTLESLGQAKEAEQAYRQAASLDSDEPTVFLNLGALLLNQGRLDEARTTLKQGLNVNPLSAMLYYNLAQVEKEAGRKEEAEKDLKLSQLLR